MKYLDIFNKLECFTYDDVLNVLKNENSANSMLQYYKSNSCIVQIRKGLYSTINPISKDVLASKYLIASKINNCSIVSHFSAFEYYGYFNQVSYRVFVTSKNKFNTFQFEGYEYIRLPMNIKSGIITLPNGVKITDIERTVIDSINDYDKLLGFEELINCISMIPMLDENKLILYLKEYDKNFLYQKTGFILEHFKEELDLSDDFFQICAQNFGASSRYLFKDIQSVDLVTDSKRRLTYPKNLWSKIQGENLDADI